MTDKRTQEAAGQSNMEKDPDQWTTGDESMTGAQRSYLGTLALWCLAVALIRLPPPMLLD